MSPVKMKKVFEDLREEVVALGGPNGPEGALVNEVWVELKYNPVIRQMGIHLDCNTGAFEISEGQYSPRLQPEQNPITGELVLAPRFVSGALMLKKLDSVLALIDERVPLDTLRDKPQPEQKPVLQRAS